MYNQKVLEYFKDMKFAGRVRGANAIGKALDEKSGDEIHIFIAVDESGTATETSFKAYGSVMAIAVGSFACELINDKHVKDIISISETDFEEMFGDAGQREYVYKIAIEAIMNAVKYYYEKLEANV